MTRREPEASRGRPRDDAAEAAIVEAAVALLAEVGYEHFSIGEVAVRAGVGRPTIYRRWPAKLDLVVDAVTRLAPPVLEIAPNAGRARVIASIGGWITEIVTTPVGRAVLALAGAASAAPALRSRLDDGYFRPRREALGAALDQMVARGVLRDDIPVGTMIDLLIGPLIYRWLYSGAAPSPTTIQHTIGIVWDSLAGG